MRKSKKFAMAASACMMMLAVGIAGTIGVLTVSANGGLHPGVDVDLIEPVAGTFTIFTNDGQPPASFPIEAEADLFTTEGITVDGVDFVLNPASLDGTSTTADDVATGTAVGNGEWDGVIDLADATNFTLNTTPDPDQLESTSVVAALARVTVAYGGYRVPVTAYDEFDSVSVNMVIIDAVAAGIDGNDNGKPDAAALDAFPSGTLITTGASGGQILTLWRPLDEARQVTPNLTATLDTVGGAVLVYANGPTLDALKMADAAYTLYDQGRLLVSIAGVPEDLLDGPVDVDPLGEFSAGATAAFPPPQNIFIMVNILIKDTDIASSPWVSVEQLPGGEVLTSGMDGAGIETALAALAVGTEVYGFSYDTTSSEDGLGNITDVGDQNGWGVVAVGLARAPVSMGDESISTTLTSAAVIWGSSAAPASTTLTPAGGGGGGGTCFIATAAYGTPLADDINVLRAVRDSFMLNNAVGAAFVDTYYRLSPPVADAVANNALMKAAVRTLLAPVVIVGSFVLAMPGASVVLLLACLALVVARVRRRTSRV